MQVSRERAGHWDEVYTRRGSEEVSWFQSEPTVSLELINALGIDRAAAVIDVGGGASTLVDHLLAAGFEDVSVLDVSDVALQVGRSRIGAPAARVAWLREDVLAWRPERRFGLWHDRAVFHFLTEARDRETYLETMWSAIKPGGGLVMATFADDGPEQCSGLPVRRYPAEELVALLGPRFAMAESRREFHMTPGGVVQLFTWVAGTMSD
jgi:SAM-dependent methyltransferase